MVLNLSPDTFRQVNAVVLGHKCFGNAVKANVVPDGSLNVKPLVLNEKGFVQKISGQNEIWNAKLPVKFAVGRITAGALQMDLVVGTRFQAVALPKPE